MGSAAFIAVLNKMRYTPLATDALCPMPYALCPMPATAPHVTEKGYICVHLRYLQLSAVKNQKLGKCGCVDGNWFGIPACSVKL